MPVIMIILIMMVFMVMMIMIVGMINDGTLMMINVTNMIMMMVRQ